MLVTTKAKSSHLNAAMQILTLEPNRCGERKCTDQTPPQSTRFSEAGKGDSTLRLTHAGLAPLECADACSSAWLVFLDKNLRGYLVRGKGQPDME